MLSKFQFYNKKSKLKFLDYYSKNRDTTKTAAYMLQKAETLEKQLKKDLSQFDIFEVDQMAKAIGSSSEQQIVTTLSMYSSYTDWCIDYKIGREDGMNFYRLFLNQGIDLKNYVSRVEATYMYINDEDINIIVSRLVNAQDRAYILALYEGIRGTAYSELRNLKIEDINDKTNEVILYDEKSNEIIERTIVISDKLKELLYEANAQVQYILNNGEGVGGLTVNARRLRDSKYIFKNKSRFDEDDREDTRLSAQIAGKQVKTIRSYLQMIFSDENTYDFITARSIYDSGIINKVLNAYNKGDIVSFDAGELERVLPEYKMTRNQISNMKRKIELALDIQSL